MKNIINFTIFKHQFKLNLKNLFIWTALMAFMLILVIALYPMVKEMYAVMGEEALAVIEMFGGGVGSIDEYFVVEGGQMYIMIGGIYAAILGASLINKEMNSGVSEFLYTQPVSKAKIFRNKFAVLVLNIILFNLALLVFTIITMLITDGTGGITPNFLWYFFVSTITQLQIGFLIYGVSAIYKTKITMGLSLGVSMYLYVLAFVSQVTEEVNFLKYFTPFSYTLDSFMENGLGAINVFNIISWSVIAVAALVYSHFYFRKNDVV